MCEKLFHRAKFCCLRAGCCYGGPGKEPVFTAAQRYTRSSSLAFYFSAKEKQVLGLAAGMKVFWNVLKQRLIKGRGEIWLTSPFCFLILKKSRSNLLFLKSLSMLLKVVLSATYKGKKKCSSSYNTLGRKVLARLYINMHFVLDKICLISVSNNIWTKRPLC